MQNKVRNTGRNDGYKHLENMRKKEKKRVEKLVSIQPKWELKIVTGCLTVTVRKTAGKTAGKLS